MLVLESLEEVESYIKNNLDLAIDWENVIGLVKETEGECLGWTIDTVECQLCGKRFISFFSIPTTFPCECPDCGQMTAERVDL